MVVADLSKISSGWVEGLRGSGVLICDTGGHRVGEEVGFWLLILLGFHSLLSFEKKIFGLWLVKFSQKGLSLRAMLVQLHD